MMQILIIGGGAAGMAAAVSAAAAGAGVTVAERGRKTLRKLAASGNGRGNLLNRSGMCYPGGGDYAGGVLAALPVAGVEEFWRSCGVPLAEQDEGRVYPSSFSAAVAAQALRTRAEKAGVKVLLNTRIVSIKKRVSDFAAEYEQYTYAPDHLRKSGKTKPGELLSVEKGILYADRVILAAGGAASPVYGTDGSAYPLAESLGHKMTAIKPALCALMAEGCGAVSGQRLRAGLKMVSAQGEVLAQSRGEVLFAQDGISGIAAMQLARAFEPGCNLYMDLSVAFFGDEANHRPLRDLLQKRQECLQVCNVGDLLSGTMTPAVLDWFLRMAEIRKDEAAEKAIPRLAEVIGALRISITGVRGFEMAQVTAGGLLTGEFIPETGESRLCPGLYAAGEILDVDGECGGFNLMFAVASGMLCGKNAVK